MAKVATANERRVDLGISEGSGLDRLEPQDAADVATVLGNLVSLFSRTGQPLALADIRAVDAAKSAGAKEGLDALTRNGLTRNCIGQSGGKCGQ